MNDEEFHILVKELMIGFSPWLSQQEVLDSCHEGSYLDAVIWWIGDPDITTLEDLLAVKHLDPLETRSQTRRYTKSLIATHHVVTEDVILELINYRTNKELNQIEWKSYGGVNKITGDHYSTEDSPLLRGHIFEMHYGNSVSTEGQEAELISRVNGIAKNISRHFSGEIGYPV